ncbi:MAG TPA: ATP-binding protein [Chryseolinea sp.]|nr:ATP-binding protein [Chryseolinea sp.]
MLQPNNTQNVEDLIERNEELENYFINTIIPQLFVDADLILRKYTPRAMAQFKFSPDHIGRPMSELVDNIRYSTLMENIQEVIDSGEIFEKEIQTTDLRWFQMNIVPYIIRKENKMNGVIITFVDITERIEDIRELEKLNAAHETFIYSVSHDLKGPLGNIESLILIFNQAEKDSKDQKNVSEMLKKSVQSMRKIIDELSEITKVEANHIEATESIKFNQILNDVEIILRDKIIESNATIHANIKEAEIVCSRKNLRSIIYNLLSNAIKYRSPSRKPEIFIKTEKDEGHLVISIKDNGLGIPADKLKQIFEKFTRIEKNVAGSGIGLYLVKKIVDNLQGEIRVNSTVDEGSEFKIYLKTTS